MKKLMITLAALPLVACDRAPEKPTFEDTNILMEELSKQPHRNTIVALGSMGDYVMKLDATDALVAIANKQKTVKMFSVEAAEQYAEEGTCLLNIIPQMTMQNMGTPENNCNFRLVCGLIADPAALYAVELCEQPAQPEQEQPAPAEQQ